MGFTLADCLLLGLHRVFIDEKNAYMAGCGHTLSTHGINPVNGAVVIVRPDLCKFTPYY